MSKQKDNTEPMRDYRSRQRAAGLRPVEFWVHKSVSTETLKRVRDKLKQPERVKS